MLITCPACSKEISKVAPACPFCGHPVKATTVEMTGKKWKKLMLVAVGLIVFGMVGCSIGISDESPENGMIGMFMVLGGIGLAIYAKVGSWWSHG